MIGGLLRRVLAWRITGRNPDMVIGVGELPYLVRWWLWPKNRAANAYYHIIFRSDDDRALHDHPWPNISIVLEGGYFEVLPDRTVWRGPGDIVARRARQAHRIVVPDGTVTHTLFLTGPHVREWGFHCPQGWRHWREFTAATDGRPGGRGKGCE